MYVRDAVLTARGPTVADMADETTPTWSVRANYWRGWRALGGRLELTGSELRFTPHGLDRALGGDTTAVVALRDIARVDVDRRGAVPRKRLWVTDSGGVVSTFLVPRVGRRAEELRSAVASASGR